MNTSPDIKGDQEDLSDVPWHLKLLGLALIGYLGLRAWQGIEWLYGRLG